MQNLGILDNQYNILSYKGSIEDRFSFIARNNQTLVNYLIFIKKPHNDENDNFPAIELNILNILQNVNNPYILHYIGNGNGILALNNKPPKNVNYLVFEYAPNLYLFDYIGYYNRGLTERQAKLLFRKILNGVRAIHNANICHKNLNLTSIIFDGNYNPKICNFALSSIYANNLNEYFGTREFIAPERLEKQPHDGFKVDIFSLGQLLFLIVNNIFGFRSANDKHQYYSLIKNHQFNEYWKLEQFRDLNLSNEFKDLFLRMVSYDPLQRPTIDQILNDPWMQELNNLNNEQLNDLENELRNELIKREEEVNEFILEERKEDEKTLDKLLNYGF